MPPESPAGLAREMHKRFALAALIVVVLTAAATATAALLQVSTIASRVFPPASHLHNVQRDLTPAEAGAPETIMVIGSDERNAHAKSTEVPHSDTLMLVHMDPDQGQTSILSIPRDLKVTIRGSTQKINAAYTLGGDKLALETVERVIGIHVNHIVDVDFKGFRRAVDAVGCVFVDVDRRYYNPNGTGYASINVQPGYQRMCGGQALDYVRFRHTDSDFVRVARQQDFVRQFKDQVGIQGIIDHADKLERAVGRSIQTDIHGTSDTLTLTKLIAFSIGRPVRQVHFQATAGPSYVTATPYQIERSVHDLLNPAAPPRATAVARPQPATRGRGRGGRGRAGAKRGGYNPASAAGLVPVSRSEMDQALASSIGYPLPILFPRAAVPAAGAPRAFRTYNIGDEKYVKHHAYRIVFSSGLVGEYYGVQGMDWTDPPILARPTQTVKRGARTYLQFFDGPSLHVVAWRTPRAVYWVSNTLLEGLSNAQMMAIAQSVAPVR